MVLNGEEKREIRQLWLFAKHYFSLARRLKKKLPAVYLNKTPRDIADKYPNPFDATGHDKRVMVMSAHLSSRSVRLRTIDERIEKNLGENNRVCSNYLNLCKSGRPVAELQRILLQKNEQYIHQMLRDNVAHIERSPHRNKHKEDLFKARQQTIENLTFREIYDSMRNVVKTFKKNLKSKHLL